MSSLSVSPEDYTALNTTLTVEACESEVCFPIPINNDCHVERNEIFEVVIMEDDSLDRRIVVSTGRAEVKIIDDNRKLI